MFFPELDLSIDLCSSSYYRYLAPLTPINPPDFSSPSTHTTLLSEEPVLAVTFLTVASRYVKLQGLGGTSRSFAVHEMLWSYMRGMIERLIWGQEQFGGGFCGAGADKPDITSGNAPGGAKNGGLRTLGTVERSEGIASCELCGPLHCANVWVEVFSF